jgi:hypothetical protein
MHKNSGEDLWLHGCVGDHLRGEPGARLNAHNCFSFLIRLLVIGKLSDRDDKGTEGEWSH